MRYLGMMCGFVMAVVLLASLTAGAATPQEEAVALVQSAVAFYKANGLEKTLDEVSKKGGQFNKGEMYVFIYDSGATMMAHPNPRLVGQNLLDVPDASGKKFRKEIVERAAKDGKGWSDYKYQNPKSKEIEDKTTYFEKVEDLIICCGIYKK